MTKIVHLTSAHSAQDIRIFVKQCRSLAAAGYDTVLIAPHDCDEWIDGVQVRAVPREGNRTRRFTETVFRVLWRAVAEKGDIYHFHDPDLLPIGMLLRITGAKVVYDVHENYGQTIRDKHWIPSACRVPLSLGVQTVEKLAGIVLNGFVAATPAIAGQFPASRTVVVQNFPLKDEFAAALNGSPLTERPLYIGYAGGISSSRCAAEMVEAIALVRQQARAVEESPTDRPEPRLRLAGPISEAGLKERLERLPGWSAVDYLGHLDRRALTDMLGKIRVGLVLFKPLGNHIDAQPNKLFEYMSAGLPIVCSNFPLWRELVEESQCGICVDPTSPGEIAEAIRYLLSRPEAAAAMGRAGSAVVQQQYSWGTEFEKLSSFYRAVLTT